MKNKSSIEVEEDEIICNCFQVTESTIRTHIFKKNIAQVEEVTLLCEAGGNCGSCHMLIQLFIDQTNIKKRWSMLLNLRYQNQIIIKEAFGKNCYQTHD